MFGPYLPSFIIYIGLVNRIIPSILLGDMWIQTELNSTFIMPYTGKLLVHLVSHLLMTSNELES